MAIVCSPAFVSRRLLWFGIVNEEATLNSEGYRESPQRGKDFAGVAPAAAAISGYASRPQTETRNKGSSRREKAAPENSGSREVEHEANERAQSRRENPRALCTNAAY